MKFLSSTSSSTSSSSDTSSRLHKNAISGGLLGMLRSLLCFNTLPAYYPFDRNTEFSNGEAERYRELDHGKQEELHAGNPGIVGRLMGLDSMPEADLRGTQMRPNSITRSRSLNYADTLREELVHGRKHHHHINSTLSFREAPPFVELETEDFFFLSFEGGGKDNNLLLKTRKSDKGHEELKRRRREKCRNRNKNGYESGKENSAPIMVLNDVNGSKVEDLSKILRPTSKLNINSDEGMKVLKNAKPISQRQSGKRRRSRRKKNENRSLALKVEIQSDSENSSPVSVLDFGDSPPELEVPSSEGDLRLSGSNSRRRLSGELGTDSYKHSSSSIATSNSTNNDGKKEKTEAKGLQSLKKDREFQNYAEMWEEIGKLTKLEMMELNRIYREPKQLEEFKDIGSAIGLEILDRLISEFLELLLTSKQDDFEL